MSKYGIKLSRSDSFFDDTRNGTLVKIAKLELSAEVAVDFERQGHASCKNHRCAEQRGAENSLSTKTTSTFMLKMY